MFHLASVEDFWWRHIVAGDDIPEPWRTPWSRNDDEFDLRAEGLSADDILAQFDASVAKARVVQEAAGDLSAMAVNEFREGRPNVRWVLAHLIEEYARHCGHLDLLREAVDGATND